MMESLWRLKRFDAFPKTLEDFRVKTCGGALGEGGGARARGGRGGGGASPRPGNQGILLAEGPAN